MVAPFSTEAIQLVLGIYEHYKGHRYKVLAVGRHSETGEEMVVYQALYGAHEVWVRPLSLFLGRVEKSDGSRVLRFRLESILHAEDSGDEVEGVAAPDREPDSS